jgi:hypothetical protein
MDLRLFGSACSNNGLFDQARRIFADLDPGPRRAHQYDPSSLPELERRLGVLAHEHLFCSGRLGTLLGNQELELIGESSEARGQGSARNRLDVPVGHMRESVTLSFDHAPPGGAQSGI